jgi:hypothetical protein
MGEAEIPDPALRQAARLEEMVAQTHERAADLYERWLKQYGDGAAVTLRARADRHRTLAADGRSVPRAAERSLSGFEARLVETVPAPGKTRHLAVLAGLEHLRRLVDRRIEELVTAARREGASWAEVGAALRVSRQTAHERYRDRRSESDVRKA